MHKTTLHPRGLTVTVIFMGLLVYSIVLGLPNIAAAQACRRAGDVNHDDRITPGDALLAFQHFFGPMASSLRESQQACANVVNPEDSEITPADALCIFRRFLQLSSCLDGSVLPNNFRYPAPKFSTDDIPGNIEATDINGDGIVDLVTGNLFFASDSASGSVSVLLGYGDGTFQTPRKFVENSGGSVKVADLNGDGFVDIVTIADTFRGVLVAFGNGDGTFQTALSVATGANSDPRVVTTADLNADGALDIIAVNRFSNTVSIILGNGNGTFQRARVLAVNQDPFSIIIGDLNRDDVLDLVTVHPTPNVVSVLLGHGDGTFQTAQSFAVGRVPFSVAMGDVNNDGAPDLVTDSSSNAVSILFGNGDGTFQSAQSVSVGPQGGSSHTVTLIDVNEDGLLDLITSNVRGMSILLGRGDGTFQVIQTTVVGAGAPSLVVSDLNADGFIDLAIANSRANNVAVLLGTGEGMFHLPSAPTLDVGPSPFAITVADLNADRALDLVTAVVRGVALSFGRGDGTFRDAVFLPTGSPSDVKIADLDANGTADLILAVPGSGVRILLGNGDGTFQPQRTVAGSITVVVADLDNDGNLDLVSNSSSREVLVHLGRGDGTFQEVLAFPVHDEPRLIVAGDINNDGFPDIITLNTVDIDSDTVLILLGNGDGTLQQAVSLSRGRRIHLVTLGDLNRDNNLDLMAVTSFGDGASGPAVWLGNGDGTFQSDAIVARGAMGSSPSAFVLGDSNNDSFLDLMVSNRGSNDVSVLLGNGNGTFLPTVTFTVAPGPFSVAAGDLNSDGLLDIVTAGSDISLVASGKVSVLLHR